MINELPLTYPTKRTASARKISGGIPQAVSMDSNMTSMVILNKLTN